jgi:hypothetical protein
MFEIATEAFGTKADTSLLIPPAAANILEENHWKRLSGRATK